VFRNGWGRGGVDPWLVLGLGGAGAAAGWLVVLATGGLTALGHSPLAAEVLGGGAVLAVCVGLVGQSVAEGGGRSARWLLLLPYRHERSPAATDLLRGYANLAALLATGPVRRFFGQGPTVTLLLYKPPGGTPRFLIGGPAALTDAAAAALRIVWPNLRLVEAQPPLPTAATVQLRRCLPPSEEPPPAGNRAALEGVFNLLLSLPGPAGVAVTVRGGPPAFGPTPASGSRRPLLASFVACAPSRSQARELSAALAGAAPGLALCVKQRVAISPRFQPLAVAELAALWQLPTRPVGGVGPPSAAVPLLSAPAGTWRPTDGPGLLWDSAGPVGLDPAFRHQNLALPGSVGQGKTTVLLASLAEDLRRRECAVLLLDPKGEAAEEALALVPRGRTVRFLDLADPAYSFNPLEIAAPPEVVADYVVEAVRNLFDEGEIRASSDRYLRNAITAVVAADPHPSLFAVARLLSLTAGSGYRRQVAERLLKKGSRYREVAAFFGEELGAQLAAAPATVAAKLDAPTNKLARLLSSPAVAEVLAGDRPPLDLEQALEHGEVVIVKGGLGRIGAANTAVLLQLLVGMVDAVLNRRQGVSERKSCALKIDEAHLAINRGFARTLALQRTAGLEVVAAWQADSQWEPALRSQLDALFGSRIYFATASVEEAARSAALLAGEGQAGLAPLADPQARLGLPAHWGIASFVGREGRLPPFLGRTVPLKGDPAAAAAHRAAQPTANYGPDRPNPPTAAAVRRPAFAPGRFPPAETGRLPSADLAEMLAISKAVRFAPVPQGEAVVPLPPSPPEEALLATICRLGVVSSGQLHRLHGTGLSLSTTQRRLKRLGDGGLIRRWRPYRADGGTLPLLCAPTQSGAQRAGYPCGGTDAVEPAVLARAVAVAGWLLAATGRKEGREVFGRAAAAKELKKLGLGASPLHPDGLLRWRGGALLVERDDRLGGACAAKIARYAAALGRLEGELEVFTVFLARSRARAAALGKAAAGQGEQLRPGLNRLLFAAEADLFHRQPLAYALTGTDTDNRSEELAVVVVPGL
jgi:hypothetical protein